MLTRASLKNPYALFAICMILLVLGPARLLSVNNESLGPKEIRDLAYFTVRQQIATIQAFRSAPRWAGKFGRSPYSWIRNGCSRARTTGPVS